MFIYLVKEYQAEVERIIQYGGSRNEGAISSAFHKLLNDYCRTKNLFLIPQLELKTKNDKIIKPDGTVKDALRLDWGYWESKDKYDDLEKEIEFKTGKGYPTSNILFEDSQKAILIQNGIRIKEASMNDAAVLDELLSMFVEYERPEVRDFREAIEKFKEDIPTVVNTLREMIEHEEKTNKKFKASADNFLTICHESINPAMTMADVREMMIQHILTEEIFLTVFNESQFHRENNIALELDKVVDTFFTGRTKRETLEKVDTYYKVIKRTATDIYNHQEKQKFLKVVYENFYKAYNAKAADRLGIVYTPNEIVRFMIESTDYLLHTHFNKFMYDEDVDILDPFTGTGTFVTELIDFLPKNKLEHKYKNEIHCNEVAILPYYIANLNIEYTYKQKMGKYEEFTNICFVDTLDNISFGYKNQQVGFDFGLGVENAERIKKQNDRKISVIISNPPYNANQLNENENNKNREYPVIDKRIKDTYIHYSKAQKTKVYDMYARAFRWATDRLNKNGILAFITNSSFIDSKTFDGFRKIADDEFSDIYIIDLGGNVRTNPKLSGTKHNVFGIQAGVAISFMIKKESEQKKANIYYTRRPEYDTGPDKLDFLSNTQFDKLDFTHIIPDENNNWLDLSDNDFNNLLPLANKQTKISKKKQDENAIFKLFSLGVVTNRDDWVYDYNEKLLSKKVKYLIDNYNHALKDFSMTSKNTEQPHTFDQSIKWTRAVKNDFLNKKQYVFDNKFIYTCHNRAYTKKYLYFSRDLNEMQYQMPKIFPTTSADNIVIAINTSNKPFNVLASKHLVDLHYNGDSQCLPLYYYGENGDKRVNITDWGLSIFKEHYKNLKINKDNIFYYVYSVLHNPNYVTKYKIDLTRDLPRIPFYDNFPQWVKWGKQLMDLHLNYETVKPYNLKRTDDKKEVTPEKLELLKKAKLKADKAAGTIEIDGLTVLKGIPKEAWEYKLGNRSAIEWILDQYKEKKPKDPTIRAKFNTYKFADYKEEVLELIKKVTTISVETVKIIRQMENK